MALHRPVCRPKHLEQPSFFVLFLKPCLSFSFKYFFEEAFSERLKQIRRIKEIKQIKNIYLDSKDLCEKLRFHETRSMKAE